jgi:predicted dehydrogenase
MAPLRLGVLGAARIAPPAVIKPARNVDGVEVTAIAARDRSKAEAFARKHRIATVHNGYDALIADPDIDAVYNPLPNGLHGRWTIAALRAGKHVLCEKPFTANAEEAIEVAAVAVQSGLMCMEAFHYRYHPLAGRLVDIARSGELGSLTHIDAWLYAPLLRRNDIRWQLGLAGGSLMDMGCYPIHLVRSVAGEEPEVVSASARERSAGVDRRITADFRFPSGATGGVFASMLTARGIGTGCRVRFERGSVRVTNFVAPQIFHRFTIERDGKRTRERFPRVPTYQYQLRAFVDAVTTGAPVLTGPDDSIATMRVIDSVYRAAGMQVRQPTR